MIKTDFRSGCVWWKKGYCKLNSLCDRGKFFSNHLKDWEKCDLYLLPYDKDMLKARLELERVEVRKLIKAGVRKNWRVIGDKGKGIQFIERVLREEK